MRRILNAGGTRLLLLFDVCRAPFEKRTIGPCHLTRASESRKQRERDLEQVSNATSGSLLPTAHDYTLTWVALRDAAPTAAAARECARLHGAPTNARHYSVARQKISKNTLRRVPYRDNRSHFSGWIAPVRSRYGLNAGAASRRTVYESGHRWIIR